MRHLADTHTLLWWAEDSPRLSRRARSALTADDSEILFSIASAWELAIKHSLGRIRLAVPLAELLHAELQRHGIEMLPIDGRHVLRVANLPHHHGDPFDRMLVAQAQVEGVAVLTADPRFREYDVQVVW